MKLKVTEQEIVNSILEYLTLRNIGHAHIRNTGQIINKGGKTFFGRGGKQKGAPDIMGCYKRCGFAIEVKSATGRLSPEQKEWSSKWMGPSSHGFWVLAYNVSDVEDMLRWIDSYKMHEDFSS